MIDSDRVLKINDEITELVVALGLAISEESRTQKGEALRLQVDMLNRTTEAIRKLVTEPDETN